jgi:two-component system LytT family sensor kinase
LRYNIEEANTFVDINKELEQVKAYVEIEKARFGDKLNVIYSIDNNIHLKIPSLIIQPIVENSIKHGILRGTGIGTVKIEVKKHALNEIKITIEDDGIGIPEDIISSIASGIPRENKIGISNVNSRLLYIYGTGLIIERLNKGTRVYFTVPESTNS